MTDIMDGSHTYNSLFYKNHHFNCSDKNKNICYCHCIIFFLTMAVFSSFAIVILEYDRSLSLVPHISDFNIILY